MPLTAKGESILERMRKEYGAERGERVFYASKNAGTITGVDAADMSGEEWDSLSALFNEWIEEERAEPEHAADERLPYAPQPESRRRNDENGYMHVRDTNISKACVNPYWGQEIPNWQALGLKADRVYQLLRDPKELALAAPTFNGMPLLTRHVAQSSSDARPDLRVGSIGTNARFEDPYLVADLVIWDDGPQAAVETGMQRELSSSYRYDADMVPGEHQGTKYDGVMRNIRANHVALVETGRAGSDVMVGDAALVEHSLEHVSMAVTQKRPSRKAVLAFGAITGYLAPKLAKDSKLDATGIKTVLANVNAENWKVQKPAIAAAVHSAGVRAGIAMDASMADVTGMLDCLDTEAMDEDKDDDDKNKKAEDEETEEERKARMEKRADDRRLGRDAAKDEDPETEAEKEARMKKRAEDKKAMDAARNAPALDKAAMDAAIAAAEKRAEDRTIARMRGIAEAEKAVLPIVGPLAVAMDSAEDIYKFALTQRGIDLTGVPAAAYRAMVGMLQSETPAARQVAMDGASLTSGETFHKKYAGART